VSVAKNEGNGPKKNGQWREIEAGEKH
jgi:hypothetical protein